MKKKKEEKKKIFQKIIVGFIIFAVIFVFDFWLFSPKDFSSEQEQEEPINDLNEEDKTTKEEEKNFNPEIDLPVNNQESESKPELETEEEISLPDETKIKNVPFLVQSPFAKWDDLHNEACEEAALIMAFYWSQEKKLDKKTGDQEILDLVKWQEEKWGGHYDLPVKNIVDLAREKFKIEKIYYTRVKTINDIKKELSKGNLIIIPTAGRLLNNPYYTQPGPAYHALLLIGYQKDKIIAHDPGTKRGENYIYDQEVVFQSIHDWPFNLGEGHDLEKDEKAKEVLKGEKIMIVIEANK